MTDNVNVLEQSENKDIEFKEIAASFYGCKGGNIHSPVWICGIESGGGYEELNLERGGGYKELIPIYIDNLEPDDFKGLHTWNVKDFKANYGYPFKGPFQRNAMKLLYAIKEGNCEPSNWNNPEKWDEDGIAGPNGIAMFLNVFPISFVSRARARKEWNKYRVRYRDGKTEELSNWAGERSSLWEYEEYVLNERSKIFIKERKKRTPRLIIALGLTMFNNFRKLWGVEEQYGVEKDRGEKAVFKFSSEGDDKRIDCFGYWLDNGDKKEKTMLLIVPFPVGSYGLNSNKKINTLAKELEKILGDGWLSKSLDKMTNSRLEELKDSDLISESLLFKIREVKELSNQQLTCLEQIEDLTKKPEFLSTFKEKLTGLDELKKKIDKHLKEFDELSRIAKRLCDQEELKDSDLISESLLFRIREVKELSNQQSTCLEQIKDLTKKPEFLSTFKEKLTGLDELKTKFIEHLKVFDELSRIAKPLCDQERDLVWKKVLKNKPE